jgi:DNA-binding response OmpR family regulator
MAAHTVRLLHVEDDAMQQRMIAHHLNAISEHTFAITTMTSEALALDCFEKSHFDLVLLDYKLTQGDGLHLLNRMRELDPIVPIIAISGVATAGLAARLVQAGADDYFDKRHLNSADLAKSIRSALQRAETVRKVAGRLTDKRSEFTNQLTDLCADYVRRMGADLLRQLDVLAQHMKHAEISATELHRMHEIATSRLEAPIGLDQEGTKLLARALLFELLVRVCDEPNTNAVCSG